MQYAVVARSANRPAPLLAGWLAGWLACLAWPLAGPHLAMDAVPLRRALLAAGLAYLLSGFVLRPELDADLVGKVALITGGSRGSGRGFAQGLSAAGATVYITGRSMGSLEEACRSVPGPGRCVPEVKQIRKTHLRAECGRTGRGIASAD
jgi:hypothetical protein